SLADHYIAYRALIRSKVACLKHEQGDEPSADRARALLSLCDRRLERGRVRLVLIGGLPGTGKSTVAAGLSDLLGFSLLRSDEIRKDLTGTAHRPLTTEHAAFEAGIYDAATTDRTYDELVRRAGRLLSGGESVILDASWTNDAHRVLAADIALATSSDLIELRCDVASEVAVERIRRRRDAGVDASDADAEIARAMAGRADPWPTAVTLDTTRELTHVLEKAVTIVAPNR
ncbi:MAG: AAA family ATPase, partial [Actinomycetota bacterium]